MGQQSQVVLPTTRKEKGNHQLKVSTDDLTVGTYYLVAKGRRLMEPVKLVVLPTE